MEIKSHGKAILKYKVSAHTQAIRHMPKSQITCMAKDASSSQ